jgi:two-component system, cell cycle response regulator DivK
MKKVLYVEDDAINALVVQKLLQNLFTVVHVDDGEECLSLLSKESFDIVLMDINLGNGKMDGVETLKMIRMNPAFAQIRVMAVTSYAMPEDRERFLKEGFDDYHEKPVERDFLIEQINTLIG